MRTLEMTILSTPWSICRRHRTSQELIDIPTAARARLARMNTAKFTNPGFSLNAASMNGSFTESAFYLSVFGDPVKGEAPREWVNVFFRKP